jgi:hypothetical protein
MCFVDAEPPTVDVENAAMSRGQHVQDQSMFEVCFIPY